MMLIKILAVDGQHSDWRWSEPITTCFFIAFVYLYGIVKPPEKDKKNLLEHPRNLLEIYFSELLDTLFEDRSFTENPGTWIDVLPTNFVDIGKAEVTKPLFGIHHKNVRFNISYSYTQSHKSTTCSMCQRSADVSQRHLHIHET